MEFIVNSVFSFRQLGELPKKTSVPSTPLGHKETKKIRVQRSFNTQKNFHDRFSNITGP